MRQDTAQLGFDALLTAAAEDNRKRKTERETAHLPGTMEEAIPFYRLIIRQHHAAILAADAGKVTQLRREAKQLALRLNDGDPGILARPDAPGYVLARETAAPSGAVPLWGQDGDFVITVGKMRVRIELDGLFGIASSVAFWPGFAAHAVDDDRPFISETGYRSFLGIHAAPVPDLTPDEFAAKVIAAHIERELKGRLRTIAPRYRTRRDGA
jgi:hypothetical protein